MSRQNIISEVIFIETDKKKEFKSLALAKAKCHLLELEWPELENTIQDFQKIQDITPANYSHQIKLYEDQVNWPEYINNLKDALLKASELLYQYDDWKAQGYSVFVASTSIGFVTGLLDEEDEFYESHVYGEDYLEEFNSLDLPYMIDHWQITDTAILMKHWYMIILRMLVIDGRVCVE